MIVIGWLASIRRSIDAIFKPSPEPVEESEKQAIRCVDSSLWFDAGWYRDQYPEALDCSMSAAEHYVRIGQKNDYKASAYFDDEWYLEQNPDVARAGIDPFIHFVMHGDGEGRLPAPLESGELESALWSDPPNRERTVRRLHQYADSINRHERSVARLVLGRWYAFHDQWQAIVDVLHNQDAEAGGQPELGTTLLAIEALARSGRPREAWEELDQARRNFSDSADTHLQAANLVFHECMMNTDRKDPTVAHADRKRLSFVNEGFRMFGAAILEFKNPEEPLALDNLIAAGFRERASRPEHEHRRYKQPLVSVIMPMHNAVQTLSTALEGLLQQTLALQAPGVLEIILVDDASTDDTLKVATGYAERHPEIRTLKQARNHGAYAARNVGLRHSRGAFICVHDADDWSHPEKLSRQVEALQANPEWQACTSSWVRCTDAMVFGHWRIESGWIYRNVSSLMFRRAVFDTLGYWDRVRTEADTEYFYRIRSAFGAESVGEVDPGLPLSFGRVTENSLTHARDLHLSTEFGGVRAEYRQASQAWHGHAREPSDLYLCEYPSERPFNVPAALLP